MFNYLVLKVAMVSQPNDALNGVDASFAAIIWTWRPLVVMLVMYPMLRIITTR